MENDSRVIRVPFYRFYQVNYTHLEFQCVLFAKEFNKGRIPLKLDTGYRLRSFVCGSTFKPLPT
jgi:hypothetical protein